MSFFSENFLNFSKKFHRFVFGGNLKLKTHTKYQSMAVSNPNKALWEKGDFRVIAKTMRFSAEELVSSLGITSETIMLDLGCGDGTTAFPASSIAKHVRGIDLASNLVEAANHRLAKAARTNTGISSRLSFEEGDAMDLKEVADDSFDLCLSSFGAMFAPRPDDVARELLRVCKKGGGRIVMCNWIPGDPDSFVTQLLALSAKYSPTPSPGFISPMLWGKEELVKERFAAAGEVVMGKTSLDISCQRNPYFFISPKSPAEYAKDWRNYYGPTMNAYSAAEADGKLEDLHSEVIELFNRNNQASDGSTKLQGNFLKVIVCVL